MAPLTVATANLAYDKATTKLKQACTKLELNIPPSDTENGEASTSGAHSERFGDTPPWKDKPKIAKFWGKLGIFSMKSYFALSFFLKLQ